MEKLISFLEKTEKKLSKFVLLVWTLIMKPILFLAGFLAPVQRVISEFLQNILRSIIFMFIGFIQKLNSVIGPRAWSYYSHKITNFTNKVKQEKAARIKVKNEQVKAANAPAEKNSIFGDFGLYIEALVNKLSHMSPAKFATMGFLFLVMMLNTFHFISTSTSLVSTIEEQESTKARREIASTMEEIPDYYNNLARLSAVKGLKIPAFSFKTDKIKSLEVDTQILFYSRSAKQFFDKNMIIFIDHLEMSLEPVQPSFPLSPEGRVVLKEKIKYEIDLLLNEYNIDSHVENVFFTNIFAN